MLSIERVIKAPQGAIFSLLADAPEGTKQKRIAALLES